MWKLSFSEDFRKQFKRIDSVIQKRIMRYIDERVAPNPRQFGEGLIADKKGLWRYRVGDYRVIAHIQDEKILVLLVSVGHRKDVYGGH